jgi:chromosome segregation ATPase
MQRNKEHATMGRPPIGNQAMTSTERSRRRRERLRTEQPATEHATKPDATKLNGPATKLSEQEMIDAVKFHVAAGDKAEATARQLLQKARADLDKLAARNDALHASLKQKEYDIGMLERELRRAEAVIAKLKAKPQQPPRPPREPSEIETGLRTQVRNLTTELQHLREKRPDKMSRPTYAKIQSCLHTDKSPTEEQRKDASGALSQFWQASNRASK